MQRDLVLRAKDGDADAFTELVRVSAPRLRGVANLILRDPDRAKDAVQEAFIAAWKDLRTPRDPDAWDAWLRRLTVRTCYRLAKRERGPGLEIIEHFGPRTMVGEAGAGPAATAARYVEHFGPRTMVGQATRPGGLESVKESVASIDESPVEAVRKLPVNNGSEH